MIVIIESGIYTLERVIAENQKVIVNFWGECKPCHKQNANLKEISKNFNSKLTVACVNIDTHREIKKYFQIQEKPTLMVYYRGRRLQLMTRQGDATRIVGMMVKSDLEFLCKKVVNLKA